MNAHGQSLAKQCVWALGNIAGDGTVGRDLVLSYEVLPKLMELLRPIQAETPKEEKAQLSLRREATRLLGNLCGGKPRADWKYVQPAIAALKEMLSSEDGKILEECCWAFTDLCDQNERNIQAIKANGSLREIIKLLEHESFEVRHPAMRAIGNILAGGDDDVQSVLDLGALESFRRLLTSKKLVSECPLASEIMSCGCGKSMCVSKVPELKIKREICFSLSNVAAGSRKHIEAMISANLFQPLINITKTEKYQICKEALYAISNALIGGDETQIFRILEMGAWECLKNAPLEFQVDVLRPCDLPQKVERSMKSMFDQDIRFLCKCDGDIPPNVLEMIMCFVTGSTLNVEQEILGCSDMFSQLINILLTKKDEISLVESRIVAHGLCRATEIHQLRILEIGAWAPLMRYLRDASQKDQDSVLKEYDLILFVELPMNLLLSGYSRSGRELEEEIPSDILGMTMRFLAGSTLNVKQNLAGRGNLDAFRNTTRKNPDFPPGLTTFL